MWVRIRGLGTVPLYFHWIIIGIANIITFICIVICCGHVVLYSVWLVCMSYIEKKRSPSLWLLFCIVWCICVCVVGVVCRLMLECMTS